MAGTGQATKGAVMFAGPLDPPPPLPDPPAHHHHHRRRHDPPFQTATASWYDYGGTSTGACGQLVANGVANRALPCGTKLEMCAERCVAAVVDDRGPFIDGRTFDLSLSLADSMGFDTYAGVGRIRWRFAVPEGLWRE